MQIADLEKGDKGRLVGFGVTSPQYKRRLLSLGMTFGTEFQVVRRAPLGCPIQIEVRGSALTLRKEEASHLVVERL